MKQRVKGKEEGFYEFEELFRLLKEAGYRGLPCMYRQGYKFLYRNKCAIKSRIKLIIIVNCTEGQGNIRIVAINI